MARIVRDRRTTTALVAALCLVLTACTPSTEGSDPTAQHDLARTPVASGEQLGPADVSGMQLPTQFDSLVTVAPP